MMIFLMYIYLTASVLLELFKLFHV
uniref:Uncharacterized protein n=1 Tax=Anguilla anguilla TaxID=7936 RepID=A0A0E9XS73_ANGAN